jgi:hypothetical protein
MSKLAYIPWVFGIVVLAYFLAVEAAIQAGAVTLGLAKQAFRAGYTLAESVDPR